MRLRKLFTGAAAVSALAVAGPIAAANATAAPSLPEPAVTLPPLLSFTPPSVGPICVTIGPIIIGGKVMSPGLHVCTNGASLPPLSTQPAM
jgi:hypothetical protein